VLLNLLLLLQCQRVTAKVELKSLHIVSWLLVCV